MSIRDFGSTRPRHMLLVAASSLAVSAIAAPGASAAPGLKTVPGTYASPTSVTQPPGTPNLLFVTEKTGKIAVLRDGKPVSHSFLDMTSQVSSNGEQGLLS